MSRARDHDGGSNTRRFVFWAALFLFAITMFLGVAFFPHICWRIGERRMGLENVQGLADREFPDVEIADDWVAYFY